MRFKKSLSDTKRGNDAAIRNLAAMTGKPVVAETLNSLPDKRVRAKAGSDGRVTEAAVISAVASLLCKHPQVLVAWRMNSGSAIADSGAYVKFHRWLRMPEPMRMSDFFGFTCPPGSVWLQMGEPERPAPIPFAIEVKRPSWSRPVDKREHEQATFLEFIRSCGGRAGFATDALQAQAIIEGKTC
jgi:hypothetical protein